MRAAPSESLDCFRKTWAQKAVLRLIYDDFYERIAACCRPGRTIEIGGGIGNLKERIKDVISTDLQPTAWLDCVADAQRLPFAYACASNIVMVDVLHHLEFPLAFFREAARVLQPGGRTIMVEPAISWGSTLFYRMLHREPVRSRSDALANGSPRADRDPYESNQAIPTIIATRQHDLFHQLLPELRIVRIDWFSFAAYPLSGGFQPWSLVTPGAARRLLALERKLEPALGRFMGFRMMLVVEKIDASHAVHTSP